MVDNSLARAWSTTGFLPIGFVLLRVTLLGSENGFENPAHDVDVALDNRSDSRLRDTGESKLYNEECTKEVVRIILRFRFCTH
jgi:hypothetical protein